MMNIINAMLLLFVFLLMPFPNVFGQSVVGALLRRGQTLIQKMQENLRNDLWSQHLNETLELLKSLVDTECQLAKFEEIKDKWAKEMVMQFCVAKKGVNLDTEKLDGLLANFSQIMKEMRNAENTVAISIEGVYGTMTEILAKAKMRQNSVKLRTYVKVIKTIHMINKQIEYGPEKDAIEEVLKIHTVAWNTNTVPVMPREMVGLTKELWALFLQKFDELDQNNSEYFLNSFRQLTLLAQTFAVVWIALCAIKKSSSPCPLATVLLVIISSLFMLQKKCQDTMMKNGNANTAWDQKVSAQYSNDHLYVAVGEETNSMPTAVSDSITSHLDKMPAPGYGITSHLDKMPAPGYGITSHLDKMPAVCDSIMSDFDRMTAEVDNRMKGPMPMGRMPGTGQKLLEEEEKVNVSKNSKK